MATYSQTGNKRQKLMKDTTKILEMAEYFPGITKIEYKGDSVSYDDTLCYHYYNANERIHGRTMEDWIRPAVSITAFKWNGSDLCGRPTFQRNWDDNSQSLDNYKRFIKAGFEFCTKLGIKHWTAFDRDIVPEMDTYEESSLYLEDVSEFIHDLQQRTGLKPLWIAPDLHSSSRYASGAGSSYDSSIVSHAAYQVKKCLDLAHKLNSECFLIWSGREGFNTVLNTDIQREMKHFSRLLKMTSDYKERLGYRGLLLLQSRQRVDSGYIYNFSDSFTKVYEARGISTDGPSYSYDWDPVSGLCFLKNYNLDRYFKLCVHPGHQLYLSSAYNATGCIEICQNDRLNIKEATLMMKNIIEQGGVQPGGINIRITPSRDSVEHKDLFISYVNCIDTLARGLRISAKMLSDQTFSKSLQHRYVTFYSGFGSRLGNGEASLEDCDEQVRKSSGLSAEVTTGRQEHWEAAFQHLINKY